MAEATKRIVVVTGGSRGIGRSICIAMAGAGIQGILNKPFSEQNAAESGFTIEKGCEMMEYFLKV